MIDFNLYLVTDRKQTGGRPLVDVVHAALDGGLQAVQLREKDLDSRALYNLAVEIRVLTRQYSATFLINDRIDVALATEADGVHLGTASFPVSKTRQMLGKSKIIGVSTHSSEEVTGATGADFIVFGPTYSTPSKTRYGPPQGLERLRQAVRQKVAPVLAIGGIRQSNIRDVLQTSAAGIAAISAITAASDPAKTVRAMLGLLRGNVGT